MSAQCTRVKRIPATCQQCGKDFQAIAQNVKNGYGQYCSRACYAAAKTLPCDVHCAHCGTTFHIKRNRAARQTTFYCSLACKAEAKLAECQCARCGKTFRRWQSQVRGDTVYCSRECQFPTEHGVPYTCPVCGKEFLASTNFLFKGRKYCSLKCGGIARQTQEQRLCQHCQKPFMLRPSHLRRGAGKFCSISCRDAARRIEADRGRNYGTRRDWRYAEWRTAVLTRDNCECQDCGSRFVLRAHHLLSWSKHPERRFDVSNGITLCESCHKARHRKKP